MSGSGKFSFGFSKTVNKSKLLKTSRLPDEIENKEATVDYLTSFEGSVAQSKVTISNDGPIIPLRISQSNIREKLKKKYIGVEPTDNLTAEALKALLSENSSESDIKPTLSNTGAIALPPKESEEGEDDIADADYEQIPVEKFGLALLKGMGLKEEDMKQNTTDDYAAKVRLKGLGLGADPEVLKKVREAASRPGSKDVEKLSWKVGAKCQIIYGRHSGQYGLVEGIDGDIGRVVVKLAASKRIVKVMQATVRLVSKAEFEKYGNYLNMSEAKKYKENEPERREITESRVNGKGGHSDAQMEDFSAKRIKRGASRSERKSTWLQKGLIVRYLDRGSKYYLQKVTVLSVSTSPPDFVRCSCKTSSGRVLSDIREGEIQTTVPKLSGKPVIVVGGLYTGEVGEFVERDGRSSRALVSLRSIKRDVYIDLDDICCFDKLN
ncbi:hypothetical protein Aperf_G00000028858 [Anoplocephala perfoliata]